MGQERLPWWELACKRITFLRTHLRLQASPYPGSTYRGCGATSEHWLAANSCLQITKDPAGMSAPAELSQTDTNCETAVQKGLAFRDSLLATRDSSLAVARIAVERPLLQMRRRGIIASVRLRCFLHFTPVPAQFEQRFWNPYLAQARIACRQAPTGTAPCTLLITLPPPPRGPVFAMLTLLHVEFGEAPCVV